MHGFETAPDAPESKTSGPWYTELNRYHWFVLIVAALGWLFDTMDQQIFVLARVPAMRTLLTDSWFIQDGPTATTPSPDAKTASDSTPPAPRLPTKEQVTFYGGIATSVFMFGWAFGGIIFGVLGDRIGRAKTMILTILIYSLFTGLSGFSHNLVDFLIYRFLTGLGVGGEFAVGVALVAEVMPSRARPFALALLQALSGVGNITAALMDLSLKQVDPENWKNFIILGVQLTPWRILFMIGALPALLAILIRRNLKEPEQWQKQASGARSATSDAVAQPKLGSYAELLGDPRWRKHAFFGMILGASGVIGLWSIGFYVFDLVEEVLKIEFAKEGMSVDAAAKRAGDWKAYSSLMLNAGAVFGIYAFSNLSQYLGRKTSFAISFIAAMTICLTVFLGLNQQSQIYYLVPLLGFCVLSIFGGYAIYFPELFPTRLRSTGTSFCYNVGRIIAAFGPFILGWLRFSVFKDAEGADGLRYAGASMCAVFLIGLIALPFLPETKGKPLPE
jgi:MFS family permease